MRHPLGRRRRARSRSRSSYEGVDYPAQLADSRARTTPSTRPAPSRVLVELGFDPEPSLRALETFAGTGRRFELHGTVRGVRVYDDYAHHPTEVAAALATARSVVGVGSRHRRPSAAPLQPHPDDGGRLRRDLRAARRPHDRARRLRRARRPGSRGDRRARRRAVRRPVPRRLPARLAGGRRPGGRASRATATSS